MHLPTLIERKRDGGSLSADEIRTIIRRFTSGEMPEYQMSALAMAIYFNGMSSAETAALTDAMLHSGETLSWPADAPLRVDKHSTGGIGDKTSLILAPLLACDGLWVPMISGRGLGITGGTLDKLDSIPGFRTSMSEAEIHEIIRAVGCVMVGQTANICPADKKLYALRDVTATVPSIPLIVASIMSKKLAEGLNRLVLDVKHGAGAFMKTEAQAQELAQAMIAAGEALGVRTTAMLNPMDEPLGEAAGNALEVAECVRCLQGKGPHDLVKLTLDLAAAVSNSSRDQLQARLYDGSAWARFQQMVAAQGGDVSTLERLTEIHAAPFQGSLPSPHTGELRQMNAESIGRVIVGLGGGRAQAADLIDFAVGIDQIQKVGTQVEAGQPLLRVHARTADQLTEALHRLQAAVSVAPL